MSQALKKSGEAAPEKATDVVVLGKCIHMITVLCDIRSIVYKQRRGYWVRVRFSCGRCKDEYPDLAEGVTL